MDIRIRYDEMHDAAASGVDFNNALWRFAWRQI